MTRELINFHCWRYLYFTILGWPVA